MNDLVTHFFTGLSVQTRIGIHATEKAGPQRILIDFEYDVRHQGRHADEISAVLDYDGVRELVERIALSRHFNLQETLCREILEGLLARAEVVRAKVSTRKPDVYPDVEAVGVVLETRKT
jgi:dihydroneopterin aldolase